MKRRLLIGLLAFGTVAGFGSGIASLACGGHQRHHERRAAFEAHVADVCTEAAFRARDRAERGERGERDHHGHHHRP